MGVKEAEYELNEELLQLQELFTEKDSEIAAKRREVLATVRENAILSFPTDLSVLSAFDDLLLCFALGGQVRNYYRYGTYTTCAAQREKFWFAMWNGSVSESEINVDNVAQNPRELERRKTVQEFYKKRLFEKKLAGLSEDIWSERPRLLINPFKE
ncbi:CIC11C00000003896 [Sungouiella intermedia]|uniref:CIC11C00000003896 n=1 Tax=Sungouiella intermedia TaxID=45354 RepID=A0A1L0E314_9ASCO|nr:CIC11C00000003896 [[Candida] intermedia]